MNDFSVYSVICSCVSSSFIKEEQKFDISNCPYFHGLGRTIDEARGVMLRKINETNKKVNGKVVFISDDEATLTGKDIQFRWRIVLILSLQNDFGR